MRQTIVKLPRSSVRRTDEGFLKLLLRVESQPTSGADFIGRVLKPGAEVELSALRPTLHYPAVPILLEYANTSVERARRNQPGYRINPVTHIVWLYVPERNEWREVARCQARDLQEWVPAIAGVCNRLLAASGERLLPDVTGEIKRFRDFVEWRLRGFPSPDQRLRLLNAFHEIVGGGIAANLRDGPPPVQLALELSSTPASAAPKKKGPARQESQPKKRRATGL